ncbi:MAG: UbiA family prenyltransferase [Chloroflexota bacterium]
MRKTSRLLVNHLDAWVVAMAIVVAALLVHAQLALETLPLVLVIGSAYWLAFAINDYFDAPQDRLVSQKADGNYFADNETPRRWFWLVATALILFIILVITGYGWTGWLVVTIGAFAAWAYSAPPIRLKERPGLDLVSHAVFVESYPYVAALLLMNVTPTLLDGFILVALFLSSLSAQLEQQLRDFDLDETTGRTFATVAGRQITYRLLVGVTLTLLVGAGTFYLLKGVPAYLVPFGFIPLPALLHRLWRGPSQPRSPGLVVATALVGLGYTIWLVVQATGLN